MIRVRGAQLMATPPHTFESSLTHQASNTLAAYSHALIAQCSKDTRTAPPKRTAPPNGHPVPTPPAMRRFDGQQQTGVLLLPGTLPGTTLSLTPLPPIIAMTSDT